MQHADQPQPDAKHLRGKLLQGLAARLKQQPVQHAAVGQDEVIGRVRERGHDVVVNPRYGPGLDPIEPRELPLAAAGGAVAVPARTSQRAF